MDCYVLRLSGKNFSLKNHEKWLLEAIRKLFLSENFEVPVWQGTGSEITAGAALATLRIILGSVTKPGGIHRNLQFAARNNFWIASGQHSAQVKANR